MQVTSAVADPFRPRKICNAGSRPQVPECAVLEDLETPPPGALSLCPV